MKDIKTVQAEEYASRIEFAKRRAVSVRTVDNWLAAGVIPAYRYGAKLVRIPIAKADAALEVFFTGNRKSHVGRRGDR